MIPITRRVVVLLALIAAGVVSFIVVSVTSTSPTTRNERSWLAAARHAQRDPSWDCRPTWQSDKRVNLPGLGAIDQICYLPPLREVSFLKYSSVQHGFARSGVIYSTSPGVPRAQPDSCVRRINGPWWRFVQANPNCPSGYQVVGGG